MVASYSSGAGVLLLTAIILAVVALIFIFYGLPAIRNGTSPPPQINIPKDININIYRDK